MREAREAVNFSESKLEDSKHKVEEAREEVEEAATSSNNDWYRPSLKGKEISTVEISTRSCTREVQKIQLEPPPLR